jgi:hypothetical protein
MSTSLTSRKLVASRVDLGSLKLMRRRLANRPGGVFRVSDEKCLLADRHLSGGAAR